MWSLAAILSLNLLVHFAAAQLNISIFDESRVAPSSAPGRRGYTLTWSDNFEAPSISQANWLYDVGTSYPKGPKNWGTGEIQTYTTSPQNLYVSPAGYLTFMPLLDPKTRKWTSARIETVKDSFKCQAGGEMIIEARILLPRGGNQEGVWTAFWAMGRNFRRGGNHGWPGTGEWDIMESVNGVDKILGTVHCGVYPGGPCNEPNGVGGTAAIARGVFINYSLRIDRTSNDWRQQYLAWSLNGNEYHRVTGSDIGDYKVWASLVYEPFFILMNVAIGGAFPNAWAGRDTPTKDTTPGYGMLVDWVAVYNR